MVTLEQVEQLDKRVRKVVELVETLRRENEKLYFENRKLSDENQRIQSHLQDSERRSLTLVGNQELLEKGLIGAIDRLESLSSPEGGEAENCSRDFSILSLRQEEELVKNNMMMNESVANFKDVHTNFVTHNTSKVNQNSINGSQKSGIYGADLDSYKMDIF